MKYAGWFLLLILFNASCLDAQIAPTLTVPRGHKTVIRYYNFTPNDKYLVSTDEDHLLCIWDGDDGRQLFTFQDSTASFNRIEINNASNLIAALTDNGKLYLIHLNSLKAELVKDSVLDFSMQKNNGTIFMIAEQAIYKYIPGQSTLKKLKTGAVTDPAKIFTLSENEVCIKESGREIFILNELTGRRLPIPGTKYMTVHDLHAETGYILCSEIEREGDAITYFNIDTKNRVIRSRLMVTEKGQFRQPSCVYGRNNTDFLTTGMIEDPEGMMITNPPYLYSFKTGKLVREAGSKFVYNISELNLNMARNAYVSESEPDVNLKIYRRHDPGSSSDQVIFFRQDTSPDPFYIACANKSSKVAIFNNHLLLPGIFPSGKVESEGFTDVKTSNLHINFFQDDPGIQGKKAGKKIGFLAEDELALNDSVIIARRHSIERESEAVLYYLKRNQVIDSFRFRYDHLSTPLQGTTRLFWIKSNRYYDLDISRHSVTDSFDLAPRIMVQKIRPAGNMILIDRIDSLANPKYASLGYNITEKRITDTLLLDDDDMLSPYEELNYAHRVQGYMFQDMTITDYDHERQSLFEYPYQVGRVDTLPIYDSLGNLSEYKVIQQVPYFRYKVRANKEKRINREIGEKTGHLQIGQVRYWDDSCYLILSMQNRLLLYSAELDSVIRTMNCVTDRYSRLFPLRNRHMLISNKNRNDSYIINPANGATVAHIRGFYNPVIYQPGGFLVLEDAALGIYNIYRENDYGMIATITSFSRTDYVVKTANGLFDGTEDAIQNLYFLIHDATDKVKPWKTIDLNQLKAKYYIPGLWEKLMSGDSTDLPDVESIKNLSMAPEIICDSTYTFTRPYKVTLTDKGGGIGAVRVLINGKEIIADARKGTSTAAKKIALSIDLSPYKDYFSGEKNTIQVFSSNADSSLVSRGIISNATQKSPSSANPRLFVISVGTSNYKGKEIDLLYSSKDAMDMAKALQMGARNLFGADSTFIYPLVTDAPDSSMIPSKVNIDRVMKEISRKADPKDIIVLYLSGHGINAGGDFCYLTADAYTANPSAYLFKELLQAVAISSKEFTEYFKKITARKQLLIIDACASGKVVENLIAHRDIPYSTLKALDRLKDRTGTHIITGCAADAVSYEASRYGQGLLTYSLLEGIKGASLRENKFLDVVQWFQYARERVPQLADGLGGIQTPQVYSPTGNQSFDIALLDEEAKKDIPLAAAKPVYIKSYFQEEENFADQIQLAAALDNLLTEKSAQLKKAGFIFFPVDEFPDAFRVLGRYKLQGGEINADIRVFKSGNPEPVTAFQLKANDKHSLAASIMEKVTELK